MYEEVKKVLEDVPQFRERRFRGHFIFIMALRNAGVITGKVKSGDIVNIVVGNRTNPGAFAKIPSLCESYVREWRACMKDYPTLRGSDYNDKTILEQEKQITLGYEPRYKEMTVNKIDELMETI